MTGGPVIRSAAVLGDGTGKVEVTHEPQVRRIELRVRRAGTAEVVAVLSDFALDGALTPVLDRWRSAGRVTLPPVGDFAVDVSVWSADGERTDKTDASRVTRRLRSKLSDVRISPEVYDAESGPLDLTGRLTSFDPDGTERPLAGARVTSGDGVFVTRADGTFSGKAPAARMVTVTYAGDGTHGATWADSNTIAFRELETRISIASTKAPLAGDKVTVSGLLERRTAAGAWGPLPRKPLAITFYNRDTKARERSAETVSGADGRYSVAVPVPASGQWQAAFDLDGSDRGYGDSAAGTGTVYVHQPTAVTATSVGPSPVAAGGAVTVRGQVVRPRLTGARAVATDGLVTLQFSADGKDWRNLKNVRTDGQGRFTAAAAASKDGYWRAWYDGGPFGNASSDTQDQESFGKAGYVDVRYGTRFTSFNASPEPVRKGRTLTVAGRLQRNSGGWKAAGAGAVVNVYFRAKGTSKWTLAGNVKTDSKGAFRKGFKASKDGTWMASYKGSGTYLGSSGPGDYVDVR
ncbi:hypothetical protein GEV43_14470 [Actinomadura sp. J1-007]|uniref:hypothetical protein n=1 Tax=Actinomadura sp. J1-007 TaxID=2661913 RepID=UPI001322EDDA|nr:hypothetical protein [Actinomadura sp. J1-007]MWK35118.1 hypothetical protein [Actinomadura sp. J1-007]